MCSSPMSKATEEDRKFIASIRHAREALVEQIARSEKTIKESRALIKRLDDLIAKTQRTE